MFERPFVQHCINNNIDISMKDIYTFGVYHGSSMVRLHHECRRGKKIPHKFYGFDSFLGLPAETEGIECLDIHFEGQYSAIGETGQSIEEIIDGIRSKLIYNDQTEFIPGFFGDVLNAELREEKQFRPAAYIEIDVDIHKSAYEVLDFMCTHHLVVPGTIIYYDDWGGVTEWEAGESLAHKQMSEKYGIETGDPIHDLGDGKPHRSIAYRVTSID